MQARSIPSRKAEFLVGASSRNGRNTTVAVWRNHVIVYASFTLCHSRILPLQINTLDENHNLRNTASASFPSSNSFVRQIILGVFVYLLCSLVQPFVLEFASVTNNLSFALGNRDLFGWNSRQTYPVQEPEPSQPRRELKLEPGGTVVQHSLCQTGLESKPTWAAATARRARRQETGLILI
jgi:hypothetical protein